MMMKKIFLSLLLVGSFIFSSAQGMDTYLEAKKMLREKGYTIDKDLFGMLAEKEFMYYEKTFYAGWEYVIVTFSPDGDVKDIDIYLYESDGSLYKKDADTKDIAALEVETSYTRTMKIKVLNYKSETPTYESKCFLLVASRKKSYY